MIADGIQAISKEILEVTQQNMQRQVSQMSDLAACKTPGDVYTVQSRIMRENIEAFIAATRRISEVATNITQDATSKLSKVPPA
jgi:phasin family protein